MQAAGDVLANLLETHQDVKANVSETSVNAEAGYVLCVDGGGSKCSAVIISSDGAVGHGESGPCNPCVKLIPPQTEPVKLIGV